MCVTWLDYVCDMTRLCVWHDSIMCVTWLNYKSPLQSAQGCCVGGVLRCVAVCYNEPQCVPARCSVLQCVAVCCSVLQSVVTSYNVWQCVAAGKVRRLCSKRWEIIIMMTWLIHMWTPTHSSAGRDSFTCVTWLIHTCDVTQSYQSSALRSGKHAGMWRDSCTCVPWLITFVMMSHGTHVHESRHTHVHKSRDVSPCMTLLIYGEVSPCMTLLIYMCDVTQPHLWICAPLNMCHDSSLNMFHDWRMYLWICDVTQPHQSLAGCVLKSESLVRPPSVSRYINEPRHTFRCVINESWHMSHGTYLEMSHGICLECMHTLTLDEGGWETHSAHVRTLNVHTLRMYAYIRLRWRAYTAFEMSVPYMVITYMVITYMEKDHRMYAL